MAPCWYLTCVISGILWTLDELKRTLINKFPILEIEKGEDFKVLFDLFVEWAEILLNYPFCWIWEIMAQNPSFKKFPVVYTYVVSYSRGVIALQRTPSHSRGPHRTPYTCSQIIVLHKGDRIPEITILEETMNLKNFFWFPPSEETFFGI